jgi:hypothetical protein
VLLPQVSNREDFLLMLVISDDDTGNLLNLSAVAFEFEIRDLGPHHHGDGYSPFFDIGVVSHSAARITATLGNGITVVDTGVIQIRIPAAQLQILHSKTYSASLTMTDGVDTRQPFIGRLPVLYGGVHRVTTLIPIAPLPAGLTDETGATILTSEDGTTVLTPG